MNKAIAKGLVASGVMLACVNLHAATLVAPTTPSISSWQGNAAAAAVNAADSIALGDIKVKPTGSGYLDKDVVTVTFAGATIRQASLGTVDTVRGTCVDGAANTVISLTLKSVSGGTVTYEVTRNITGTAPKDTTCTLSGIEVLRSSLTANNTILTFNWSAATAAGSVHDVLRGYSDDGSPASARPIHWARSQFTATSTSFPNAGTIAPFSSSISGGAQQRFGTATSSPTGTSTSVTFTFPYLSDGSATATANATELTIPANVTLTAVYSGDFSFIDNDGNGCTVDDFNRGWGQLTVGVAAGFGTAASQVSISSDCKTLTTVGTGDRRETLLLEVAKTTSDSILTTARSAAIGVKAIAEQAISATATWTSAGTTLGSALGAASLTVDAFSAEIPYMPYGSGISRIVYFTNRSLTAPVYFSAVDEAGTSCASDKFPATTVRGGTNTLLSSAIDAGIAACYGSGWTGKVRITVFANIPRSADDTIALSGLKADGTAETTLGGAASGSGSVSRATPRAEIYSAYNVSGNRVQVINSTNGR